MSSEVWTGDGVFIGGNTHQFLNGSMEWSGKDCEFVINDGPIDFTPSLKLHDKDGSCVHMNVVAGDLHIGVSGDNGIPLLATIKKLLEQNEILLERVESLEEALYDDDFNVE